MSNVIDFLEQMGGSAQLRYASGRELKVALDAAHIDSASQSAIVGGKLRTLETLLDADPNVCCGMIPIAD